ncbi:MAG: hypothetical protein KF767_02500 [Bdellovibrionaceae bacterium]|nr:hypothetical protein [Pseudobdellovibrionaceae bacterium]
MLVNCPKCGFSQPQDQYCAKCGVDMQAFKPKPPPMSTRMLASPVIVIGLVFALVFAGSLYIIREQRRQEVTRRMDYLKNGPLYAESLQPASARDSASAEDIPEEVAESTPPPPAMAAQAVTAVAASSTTAPAARQMIGNEADLSSLGGAAPTGDTEAAARARPVDMNVHYALAPRARLLQLVEVSRAESNFVDFGEFQMGTLRGVKNMLGRLDVIENVRKRFDSPNGDQMWFVGARNTDAPLGLTTRLSLRGSDNGLLRGEIEILRSLHESPEFSQGIVQKAFGPAEFAIPPQAGLLIVLNLPRVPQYDETAMTPTQFLRIFRMPDFKQRQSDFVMLVDFESGAESGRPGTPAPPAPPAGR